MTIPAITLHEPWATLMALGIKTIETRSWDMNHYRGWMAIHAAAGIPAYARQAMENNIFIHDALLPHGIDVSNWTQNAGKVVAIGRLDCVYKTHTLVESLFLGRPIDGRIISPVQVNFGDYTPGRFGWVFDKIVPLPTPCPAKGFQRIWRWEPPADVQIWIKENSL